MPAWRKMPLTYARAAANVAGPAGRAVAALMQVMPMVR
jgi:hypothetical protein